MLNMANIPNSPNIPNMTNINNILKFANDVLFNRYENKESYKQNLSNFRSFINVNYDLFENFELNDFCSKNYKDICNRIINSPKKAATKKKTLYILFLLCKHLGNDEKSQVHFIQNYSRIKRNMKKEREKNQPVNIKEANNLNITLNDLRSLGIQSKFNQKDLLYNLLIFIDETPRLEYRTLIYESNPNKLLNNNNYLIFNDNKFMLVIDNYKTRKTYGTWYINIHNGLLHEYILQYIQHHNLIPGQSLFPNYKNNIRPSNKFSEFLQRTFKDKIGKLININSLRKIKESSLYHNINKNNWSIENKKKFVQKYFKHSLATADLYYHKVGILSDSPITPMTVTPISQHDDPTISKEEWKNAYDKFIELTLKNFPHERAKILKRIEKTFGQSLV